MQAIRKEQCSSCNKEFPYEESLDKQNNELIPMRIRKCVVDPSGRIVPLFAMPKDKQRIVDIKFMKYVCTECARKSP